MDLTLLVLSIKVFEFREFEFDPAPSIPLSLSLFLSRKHALSAHALHFSLATSFSECWDVGQKKTITKTTTTTTEQNKTTHAPPSKIGCVTSSSAL